ncbi:hypothetical protein AYJ54_31865 [Bradyrhizobium centrolobii]|uniref:Uncharacterized protein n=1 Tax=Bradyrhizobium centrolobii TaxID=1505087 RepID=A0A176YA41_9BRAD|nr:hypothetical protein AYJ54_31865 [Bradyrhizobium centrolobii]
MDLDAVSVAIASDTFRPTISWLLSQQSNLREACKRGARYPDCGAALLAAIDLIGVQLEKQRAFAFFMEKASADLRRHVRGADEFLREWQSDVAPLLQSKAPTATDPAAINPAAINFVARPDLLAKLIAHQELFEKELKNVDAAVEDARKDVSDRIHAQVDAALLSYEANKERLKGLLPAASFAKLQATAQSWRSLSEKLVAADQSLIIENNFALAGSLKEFMQAISAGLLLKATDFSSFSPSEKLDAAAGSIDFCFADQQSPGVVGVRFAFSPCAASLRPCETTGEYSLLLRRLGLNSQSKTIVPISFGVRVNGTIHDGRLTVPAPPAEPAELQRDAVAKSVALMFPYPFNVSLEGDPTVQSGPRLLVTARPLFTLLGLEPLGPVSLSIDQKGLTVAGANSLCEKIIADLAERIRDKEFRTAGLRVKLAADDLGTMTTCEDRDPNHIAVQLNGKANLAPLLSETKLPQRPLRERRYRWLRG